MASQEGSMQVDIYESDAVNGAQTDAGLVGGIFFPDDEGTKVETLTVKPVGRLKFDPDTGVGLNVTHAEATGSNWRVQVLERSGGNGTRVVPVVWISAVDRDGVVHTQEFLLGAGEHSFGYVRVVVTG